MSASAALRIAAAEESEVGRCPRYIEKLYCVGISDVLSDMTHETLGALLPLVSMTSLMPIAISCKGPRFSLGALSKTLAWRRTKSRSDALLVKGLELDDATMIYLCTPTR